MSKTDGCGLRPATASLPLRERVARCEHKRATSRVRGCLRKSLYEANPSPALISLSLRSGTLSLKGLGCAHISEHPAMSDLFEAVPTVAHGDWTWRAFGGIAGPSTEPRDDPTEPTDRVLRVGVLLLGSFAFEAPLQGFQHR